MIDLSTLDDDDLNRLIADAYSEQRRRRVIAEAPARAEQAAAAYQDAIGRQDGDPWVQPTGAHDALPLGAIVTHDGKTWESLVPANVWRPGDTNDPQNYRWWRDLTVASDDGAWDGNGHTYSVGDRVTFEGAEYECRQAHTSQPDWTPAAVPALWLAV